MRFNDNLYCLRVEQVNWGQGMGKGGACLEMTGGGRGVALGEGCSLILATSTTLANGTGLLNLTPPPPLFLLIPKFKGNFDFALRSRWGFKSGGGLALRDIEGLHSLRRDNSFNNFGPGWFGLS